jgi:hypothetical protein
VDGSTTRPPCSITILPSATSRRAAARAGSISPRHPSLSTARAASDGQIVAPFSRPRNNSKIAVSSNFPSVGTFARLHAAEQYFTASQSRSHFLRHSILRPHTVQDFSSRPPLTMQYVRHRLFIRFKRVLGVKNNHLLVIPYTKNEFPLFRAVLFPGMLLMVRSPH